MNKITPFLWFSDKAGEAADFYLSVFPEAKKLGEMRSGPPAAGQIVTVSIELMGQAMTFLNGGPVFQLSEAFSFSVACKDQEEIDYYWSKLTEGGEESRCGWLKDRFGVSWQIVPENIGALLGKGKAMQAMMQMAKLDIAKLEAAGKE